MLPSARAPPVCRSAGSRQAPYDCIVTTHIYCSTLHAGFTLCPAVSAGEKASVYQAVTAFEPGAHPDFGAAASGSYELDPGILARTLDSAGRPVYGHLDGGTVTTAGACSSFTCFQGRCRLVQVSGTKGDDRLVLLKRCPTRPSRQPVSRQTSRGGVSEANIADSWSGLPHSAHQRASVLA